MDKKRIKSSPGPVLSGFQQRKPETESTRKMARILIVDDDKLALGAMRDTVREMYEVETASNGKEALERYLQGGIDLVVTDLKIPGMNRSKLLAELLSHDEDAKVIIVSSLKVEGKDKKALEGLGALAVLEKPLGILKLTDQIEIALR